MCLALLHVTQSYWLRSSSTVVLQPCQWLCAWHCSTSPSPVGSVLPPLWFSSLVNGYVPGTAPRHPALLAPFFLHCGSLALSMAMCLALLHVAQPCWLRSSSSHSVVLQPCQWLCAWHCSTSPSPVVSILPPLWFSSLVNGYVPGTAPRHPALLAPFFLHCGSLALSMAMCLALLHVTQSCWLRSFSTVVLQPCQWPCAWHCSTSPSPVGSVLPPLWFSSLVNGHVPGTAPRHPVLLSPFFLHCGSLALSMAMCLALLHVTQSCWLRSFSTVVLQPCQWPCAWHCSTSPSPVGSVLPPLWFSSLVNGYVPGTAPRHPVLLSPFILHCGSLALSMAMCLALLHVTQPCCLRSFSTVVLQPCQWLCAWHCSTSPSPVGSVLPPLWFSSLVNGHVPGTAPRHPVLLSPFILHCGSLALSMAMCLALLHVTQPCCLRSFSTVVLQPCQWLCAWHCSTSPSPVGSVHPPLSFSSLVNGYVPGTAPRHPAMLAPFILHCGSLALSMAMCLALLHVTQPCCLRSFSTVVLQPCQWLCAWHCSTSPSPVGSVLSPLWFSILVNGYVPGIAPRHPVLLSPFFLHCGSLALSMAMCLALLHVTQSCCLRSFSTVVLQPCQWLCAWHCSTSPSPVVSVLSPLWFSSLVNGYVPGTAPRHPVLLSPFFLHCGLHAFCGRPTFLVPSVVCIGDVRHILSNST